MQRTLGSAPRVALSWLVFATLTACEGVEGLGVMGPNGTPPEGDRVVVPDPRLSLEIQEMFDRTGCTQSFCHGNGQGGLVLGANSSANHANLVNVPAESEDFLRVKPFEPDSSYLVIKFEGRQAVGEPMPPEPLDSIDLQNFRNWINNGALNN